ncbi:MAG: hypothetical protein R3C11_02170 [Planctomycetaceae bacterium]
MPLSIRLHLLLALISFGCTLSVRAAEPVTQEQLQFFESRIRPVLATHCYECHAADAKKVMGGLLLDTRAPEFVLEVIQDRQLFLKRSMKV